jgi:hypothetical protein
MTVPAHATGQAAEPGKLITPAVSRLRATKILPLSRQRGDQT